MSDNQQSIRWIFDPPSASGARTGGDVAGRSFSPSLDTFVREVLQNSRDAQTDESKEEKLPVEVHFKLIRLTGESLDSFKESLEWSRLEEHLMQTIDQPDGEPIAQALEEMQDRSEITLLRIDDYHTSGLTGSEFGGEPGEDDSRFASLCKDKLYSAKSSNTAGGSHGMGKAVLWRFSGISTVLFNSTLERTEGSAPNPRFIGRTSLPWHRVNGDPFGGPGWLGRGERRVRTNQLYAESLRGAEAARVADDLHLARKNGASGTSILVVGFREPADEDRSSLEEVAGGIAEAASRWFWPSLIGREPSLNVEISIQENEEEVFAEAVDAEEHDVVQPFIEAYRAWQKEEDIEDPSYPGDVAAVPVAVHLPAERERRGAPDPRGETTAEAVLVVRLAGDDERKEALANQVAYFRGAGMIVQYRTLRRLAISAKDYHAALICGTAKGNYPGDEALERFLRAAEPPEHDTWDSTANLKKAYKQGYKKALDDMNAEVRRRLRRLVTETTKTGAQGPDLFRKKFPIGNTGGGGSERSFVDLQDLTAYVEEDGTTRLEGRLRARSRSPKVWEATLDVRIAEEDKRGDYAKVRDFTTNQNGEVKVYRPEDGEGELRLLVNEGTRAVSFEGRIDLRGAVADPSLSSIDVKAVGHEIDR